MTQPRTVVLSLLTVATAALAGGAVVLASGPGWGSSAGPTARAAQPERTTLAQATGAGWVDRAGRPFPRARTTGVPEGVSLRRSGSLTITMDGAVIDRRDVKGSIRVQADDVVIRRTRIRPVGDMAIWMDPQHTGLVVKDVEIDGSLSDHTSETVGYSNYTLRRVHIHHVAEGPRANGDVRIEDSFIHAFRDFIDQGAHQDAIQSTGGSNITIRHNTLLMNVDGGNAAIMIGTSYGSDVLVERNLLAGGTFVAYGGDSNGWTDVRYIDNEFSKRFHPRSGYYGPFLYAKHATKSGNVWHETGRPL